MRMVFTALLVLSFAFVALFGFTGSHAADGHGGCAAAAMRTADCPLAYSSFASVFFHMDAFRDFAGVLLSIGLLAVLLLLARVIVFSAPSSLSPPSESRGHKKREPLFRVRSEFLRWLSHFENSPSVA